MKQNKEWYLGFFGLFAFFAVPGIMAGEWVQAVWLVWVVWFLFFFKKRTEDNAPDQVKESGHTDPESHA